MKSLLIQFLILICSLTMLSAKTVTIGEEHFRFDLPDSWLENPKEGMLYSAADESQTSAIVILKFPNNENLVIDATYAKGVKEGMSVQASRMGATIEFPSEGPVTIGGVPSYFVQSKMILPNARTVYPRNYVIAANGNIYVLTLNSVKPERDSIFKGIANSFKFDSTPTLPDPTRNTLSYRMGELFGTLLFLFAGFYFIKWLGKLMQRKSAP